jgi:hypothetical protein
MLPNDACYHAAVFWPLPAAIVHTKLCLLVLSLMVELVMQSLPGS